MGGHTTTGDKVDLSVCFLLCATCLMLMLVLIRVLWSMFCEYYFVAHWFIDLKACFNHLCQSTGQKSN